MWSFIKAIVAIVLIVALVMLLRSKLAGKSWATAWNDNFGGVLHVGPNATPGA